LALIRNVDKFNDLVLLLASQTGGILNALELSIPLAWPENYPGISFILENTYIIRRVRPFHRNVRSELTKMPKIFFEDSGLANILAHKRFFRCRKIICSKTASIQNFENELLWTASIIGERIQNKKWIL